MDTEAYRLVSTLGDALVFFMVAVGLAVAFRVARLPDLTCEGSFVLGGCATFLAIRAGADRATALAVGVATGAAAGSVTALLHCFMRVPAVLAGILTWMSAYSVALRMLDKPNQRLPAEALFAGPMDVDSGLVEPALRSTLLTAVFVFIAVLLLYTLLESSIGLRLRCVGGNPFFARTLGLRRWPWLTAGVACANGLAGLGGGLFALRAGYVDVNMGSGVLVTALAAMFIGGVALPGSTAARMIAACAVGTIAYMVLLALALQIGMKPGDNRMVTSVLVVGALVAAKLRKRGPWADTPAPGGEFAL